ncbi:MAG: hypothetical protein XU14_C0049G0012 [Armatimonadetes bacterium CSP1-3]|nr:MAG: hypothetical protein XU14_C0049G0012 [Armatimonadetes bacterium CSP1-3]
MILGRRGERGMAMIAVLTVILVLVVLGGLVLQLTGKEIALTAFRLGGAQSMYQAEAGAVAGRAALLALMNADPIGVTGVDPTLNGVALANWFAAGDAAAQNAFRLFDYLVTDGQRYTLNATPATGAVTFYVDWGLGTPHRKLVAAGPAPQNALGPGNYAATVVIVRRRAPHASCVPGPDCYVHRLGADEYEYFYTYTITSDGQVPPRARRRITFSRDFSVRVRRQTFAQFALFTHVHMTPAGSPIWFTSRTSFDGPVHTNGEYRFAFFPKFSDRLTSVSGTAWFNNNGSPVRLAGNENVVAAVRRDAPVVFDSTPTNYADDNDNPPANFTRGVASIPMPTNPFSQQGVSIGRDPADTSPVANLQIRQAVPELANNTSAVPTGIYIPVADVDADSRSDPGEPLAGGIFVQGDLNSLTLSLGGASNNLAVYTLVQGGQTVTITVDRVGQTTTVTNTAWASPQTRTFAGVPKGWQGPGNANAGIVFVQGNILSLAGTLEEQEQTTVAASGRIDITSHLRYEDPPDPADPNDNPLNVLGLYSAGNDIRITTAAPNDLVIHAVLMAGNVGDAVNSSVNVQNYNSGAPRGTVTLLGGIIEEYYGAFGTFDPATGNPVTGYGRAFTYDRRMARGFAPPYFPTTNLFEIVEGDGLAGDRAVWREATP